LSDQARDVLVDKLQASLEAKVIASELGLAWQQTHSAAAVACDDALTESLTQVLEQQFGDSPALVSGAGHDAMALAARVPTTMLFVRCKGGISHHPDESVEPQDVAAALYVMAQFIANTAE
jgi:allantoate deiminase